VLVVRPSPFKEDRAVCEVVDMQELAAPLSAALDLNRLMALADSIVDFRN
jgi:hypothetical protein